jgi:hypothetical protein
MSKLIIIALLSIFIAGCHNTVKEYNKPLLNENKLKDFVAYAMNGDRNYNDTLSGLIDYSLPVNSSFNDLKIDRIHTPLNKTYFSILIEYPNPAYNRFAVYDSSLNLMLLDKSLNGILRMKTVTINNLFLIEVDESFLSKDVLGLNRVSLYKVDSLVTLCFREFTCLTTPENQYYQKISEISPERIRTDLSSKKLSSVSNKSEIFSFNDNLKKYLSPDQIFFNFIKDKISSIKRTSDRPEITDEKSVLQSIGITKDADTITTASNISAKAGYSLTLTDGWKEIRNVGQAGYSDKLRGSKYYHPESGASIFIAPISVNDSAEIYVKAKLDHVLQGKYKVRTSDKIEQGKYFIQYFELSFESYKYLLIFETSKYTYEQFKPMYTDIINSFAIKN